MGRFPVQDVRRALEGIGDPFYREWSAEEENGEICIETGEEKTYTGPDGRMHSERCTDSFYVSVRDGQVDGLDWDRPLGRPGTLRALWHLIEMHELVLIDPSGPPPMVFAPFDTTLDRIEKAWPEYRENGVHIFGSWDGFRSHYGGEA